MGETLNCSHCHKRLKEGDYRNFDPQHYRPLQLKAAGCRVHHSCHIALARRAAAAVKAAAAEAAQREASGLRTTRSVSQQQQDAQPWQPRRYTPQAGEAERLGRAILTSTRCPRPARQQQVGARRQRMMPGCSMGPGSQQQQCRALAAGRRQMLTKTWPQRAMMRTCRMLLS